MGTWPQLLSSRPRRTLKYFKLPSHHRSSDGSVLLRVARCRSRHNAPSAYSSVVPVSVLSAWISLKNPQKTQILLVFERTLLSTFNSLNHPSLSRTSIKVTITPTLHCGGYVFLVCLPLKVSTFHEYAHSYKLFDWTSVLVCYFLLSPKFSISL